MSISEVDKYVFCRKCVSRKFSSSKGLLCSLTDEKPDFEVSCASFIEEEKKVAHTISLQLTPRMLRAKRMFIILGVSMLTIQMVNLVLGRLIMNVLPIKTFSQVVGIVVMVLVLFATSSGSKGARYFLAVILGLNALIVLFKLGVFFALSLILAAASLLMVILLTYWIYFLCFDKNARLFFEYQKQAKIS